MKLTRYDIKNLHKYRYLNNNSSAIRKRLIQYVKVTIYTTLTTVFEQEDSSQLVDQQTFRVPPGNSIEKSQVTDINVFSQSAWLFGALANCCGVSQAYSDHSAIGVNGPHGSRCAERDAHR